MHVPFIWRSIHHSSIATVMAAPRATSILVALSAATISASAIASEYYVATDGVDAAGRGSEASPFHTIQYAIDQAAAGDTIWVKPGIYDQGGAENSNGTTHMNRVSLTKRVNLKSTGGAAVTHIVGAPDPSTGGIGPDAVRCMVSPNDNSRGSTITGFTLRDGYGSTSTHHAGGFLQLTGQRWIYFSDCVVSNCAAFSQGGARGGTWARCLFTRNRTTRGKTDGTAPAAVGAANLIHCVIAGNGDSDSDYAVSQSTLVNCTIVCNRGRGSSRESYANNTYYNTISCGNTHYDYYSDDRYYNCATGGYPVFSPLEGDWRVVAGSAADSAGDISRLTSVSFANATLMAELYPGMASKDFAGHDIDLTAASVHAGAIQETVSTDGGVLRLAGPFSLNGISVPDGMPTYLQTTNLLTQYRVAFGRSRTSGSSTTYLRTVRRRSGNELFLTPAFDDSLMMMVPPKSGVASTNEPLYSKALWVDAKAGDDTSNSGAEASPFATIQKAVDVGGSDTVVYVAPGIYNQGGVVSTDRETAPYVNTRVWITNSNVRVVGVSGAERTVIVGAPDPGTGGLGDRAWRCVGSSKSAFFAGFTLSNGWTRACSSDRDDAGFGAAAFGTVDQYIFLQDCIVTACHAYGDICHKAAAYRCLVFGNIAEHESLFSGEWGRLVCTWVGPNTTRSSDYFGYVGQNCEAWFSTLVAQDGRSAFAKTAQRIYNSIAVGGSAVRSSMVSKGNIFWNFTTVDDGAAGTFANPRLWTDKMHVKDDSPAITAGVAPSAAGYDSGDPISTMWPIYCSADVEGNPLLFNAGGTVLAGAAHTLFPSQLPTTMIVR